VVHVALISKKRSAALSRDRLASARAIDELFKES
jgi:hypothetical protein